MRLPWVPRLAYDLVLAERDRLLKRLDRLEDHEVRVQRRYAGMPELPREPIPRARVAEAIPDYIEDVIMLCDSEAIRSILREQCRTRHADGAEWETLEVELLRQVGEPEEVGA